MNFTHVGYQAALADLGIVKEAGVFGRIIGGVKNFFSRAKPEPYMPPGASRQTMNMVDDASAGIKVKPKEMKYMQKEDRAMDEALFRRKNQGILAPGHEVRLPKNTKRVNPDIKPTAPAPAATAPAPGAPAPGAPAPGAPGAPPAEGGGILGFMRRNPVWGAGIAGTGAGGLGYVMGRGANPTQPPPMQYYGNQPPPNQGYY
jgi:hypothetical protein